MLAALVNGVTREASGMKGRLGLSLEDHRRWPNAFFAARGLFTMTEAHALARQSRCGNNRLESRMWEIRLHV